MPRFWILLALAAFAMPVHAATVLDCERVSSPYEGSTLANPPGPVCLEGGPTGSFLRLADTTAANINAIAFDLTDPGAWDQVIADFDFRMTPYGTQSRADGFGFTLASTMEFGTSGPVSSLSEEPNVVGSLGVGFDIHQGPGEVSRNHVSIHLDGAKLAEVDATHSLELASGQFTHARIIVRAGASPPDVTVTLTPCGSQPVTLIDRLPILGLVPYESRVHLMARSGGEAALHDIDNLNVQFLDLTQSAVSFTASTIEATETAGGKAVVTVSRAGNLNDVVTVDYTCTDLSARASQDYVEVSGTLTFAGGEESKTIRVPVLDDASREGEERFLVRLVNSSANAVIGAPSETHVVIVDDESARDTGHWSGVMCWPIVATHAAALPDGRIMLWPVDDGAHGVGGGDHPHAWDPATNALRAADACWIRHRLQRPHVDGGWEAAGGGRPRHGGRRPVAREFVRPAHGLLDLAARHERRALVSHHDHALERRRTGRHGIHRRGYRQ